VFISRHQTTGQNTRIAKNYSEKVMKFRYWGTTVTNQNYIYEEINALKFSTPALTKKN
jgi:hypothetical protein